MREDEHLEQEYEDRMAGGLIDIQDEEWDNESE